MTISGKIKDTSNQDKVILNARPLWFKRSIFISFTIAVIILVILLVSRFNQIFSVEQSISKQAIQLATVKQGSLKRDIAVQGRIVAAISPTLFAPTTGTISLFLKAGDQVKKNQLLATIDSPELNSQFAQQKNQLAELELEYQKQKIHIKTSILDYQQTIELAKVDLTLAQKNIERAKLNIKLNVISQVDFETQQAQLAKIELQHKHAIEKAQLQKENLEFELKTKVFQLERQKFVVTDLKRQVEELQLRSPVTGVIGNLLVREKDTVSKNLALLTLVDLSAFEIEVGIPESYADDLSVGLKTEINFDGKSLAGNLTAISPEVANGQVTGRIKFTNKIPVNLRQNQRVSARILIESKDNVLKVKKGSFVETGGGKFAFVIKNDFAEKRPIKLGTHSISEVEVISGLNAGEEIIISSIEAFIEDQKIHLSN
ncbi:efflux RND transporter periplasmic adaptor subunit [Aliikangiella sp. IMCC44359]|uniref:efflux RND transporter periplasmic adaptor subunit n=1 Tax=Aliikangiella sp. IMCC44359 TaxID=3459125 RepID=UPI00403B198F